MQIAKKAPGQIVERGMSEDDKIYRAEMRGVERLAFGVAAAMVVALVGIGAWVSHDNDKERAQPSVQTQPRNNTPSDAPILR